jgi:hypothetical protein
MSPKAKKWANLAIYVWGSYRPKADAKMKNRPEERFY